MNKNDGHHIHISYIPLHFAHLRQSSRHLEVFGFAVDKDNMLKIPTSFRHHWDMIKIRGSAFAWTAEKFNPVYLVLYKNRLVLSIRVYVYLWTIYYEYNWHFDRLNAARDVDNLWSVMPDRKSYGSVLAGHQHCVIRKKII